MTGLARYMRTHLTYANVMSTIAVVATLGTGTAYAAARIGSADVIDNSLRTVDVRDGTLTGADIGLDKVGSADVAGLQGGDVLDGSLRGDDIEDDSINSPDVFGLTGGDITDDSIAGVDIAPLTGDELTDQSLDGSELADDSVGGDEIKSGSVGAGDLSDSAKTQLLPAAYYVNGVGFVDTSADPPGTRDVVFSKNVPVGGNFVVHLAGDLYNNTQEYRAAGCIVTINGSSAGTNAGSWLGKNDGTASNEEEFAITGFGSLPEGGGPIALECVAGNGAVHVGANLVAIRVASVS